MQVAFSYLGIASASSHLNERDDFTVDCGTADHIFLVTGVKMDCYRPNPAHPTPLSSGGLPFCTGPPSTPVVKITSYVNAQCTSAPTSTRSSGGCPTPSNNCPGSTTAQSAYQAVILTSFFK